MTCKELLYVEDSLSHELFLKNSSCKTSSNLLDINLSTYLKDLEKEHEKIFNMFLNLL